MSIVINLKNKEEINSTIPTSISKKRAVNNTLKKSIKEKLEELRFYENNNVTNLENIKDVLLSTKDLIDGCCTSEEFRCNKSEEFSILTYKYHSIYLKYETWKTNKKLNEAIEKQKMLEEIQKKLEKTQEKLEKQNNNIVYNILAFIASFSIVSGAVTAFEKVSSIEDILIFMSFTSFIIVTTLIVLDNFYRGSNENGIKLKNNYFLWKIIIIIIIVLLAYKSVNYIKVNQNEIFESIGRGIESVRMEGKNN